MNYSMKLHSFRTAMLLPGAVILLTALAYAQDHPLTQVLQKLNPLQAGHSSQGYLGVDLADVDSEKAPTLKLKEAHGAIITLIDHDAPAGQIGLHVNDVVLKLNEQAVENAAQLRRMLQELPAGRKITLGISRDGALLSLPVQLADRHAMEQEIWNRLGRVNAEENNTTAAIGLFSSGNTSTPGGFHMPTLFGSGLNVGAMVEPLTAQMAEYLGIHNGLLVKQVTRRSEASTAGIRVHDVLLRFGPEPINTLSDWDRDLRANQGKSIPITILRDKKQQVLNLQVDSKRR